ncbi:MAG: hypothetical protein OXH68_15165 [Gammaproteobacteria bacterium]|nr:hypothetical protein [Gammaproteobacteria bacterium]
MASLDSQVLDRIHGVSGLTTQEQRGGDGPDPDKRQRARHGRAYRGRSSATGRQIPEMRAADHVDFAPRPEEPSLMDRALRVARGVREMLVPDTPGEWAFEAATAAFPPAKAAKVAGKLGRNLVRRGRRAPQPATRPLAESGYRSTEDIAEVFEGPARELMLPFARPYSAIWPERAGRIVGVPPNAPYQAINKSGQISIDPSSSPLVLAHEVGHALEWANPVRAPYEELYPRDAAFALRKTIEDAMYHPASSQDEIMAKVRHHLDSPTSPIARQQMTQRERGADLWAAFLQFPDSVPDFSERADRIARDEMVDVKSTRSRLQHPQYYLTRLLRRR